MTSGDGEPCRVEIFIRVGGVMQRRIGATDYPDSVPDLLRAAANVWEFGRIDGAATSDTSSVTS